MVSTTCVNHYSVINCCNFVSLFLPSHSILIITVPSIISLFLALFFFTWQFKEQYLEKSSILCFESSVAWLIAKTIFGESVIFTVTIFGEVLIFSVYPPWHGQWHEVIWWIQCIAPMYSKEIHCFLLLVVSQMLYYGFYWKCHFWLLFIVYGLP